MGIDKEGNKKDSFEPGIELLGKGNCLCRRLQRSFRKTTDRKI
jgi:hypothetical protein